MDQLEYSSDFKAGLLFSSFYTLIAILSSVASCFLFESMIAGICVFIFFLSLYIAISAIAIVKCAD